MSSLIVGMSWVVLILGTLLIVPNFVFGVNNHLEGLGYFLIFLSLSGAVFSQVLNRQYGKMEEE